MSTMRPEWQKQWVKVKPKTLVSDSLNPELAKLDALLAAWQGKRAIAALPKLVAAADAAIKGAAATKAKCNKTLHKDGIANLDRIGRELAELKQHVHSIERLQQEYMTKCRKLLVASAQAATDVVQNLNIVHVINAGKIIHNACVEFNKLKMPENFDEQPDVFIGQALTRAEMPMLELAKALKKAGPDPDLGEPAIAGPFAEVKASVARLKKGGM